jgi:hypothetical protein
MVLGLPVRVVSNEEAVLTAVAISQPLYSHTPPTSDQEWLIQIVVQPAAIPPGPAPADLMQRISYSGEGSWLMLHLGNWGQAHVDLAGRRATAVLTPEFASQPQLVSQCLLNTILLNFAVTSGLGMLHASCLVRDERAYLFLAPHHSGKSTTALRLALAGYRLLTDSMVFVRVEDGRVRLMGFPVGKVKLRPDVIPLFPELAPFVRPEIVREEVKYSLHLEEIDAGLLQKTAICPDHIQLYLLSRQDAAETAVEAATETAVWQAIMANSLYYDTAVAWQQNLAQLRLLVERVQSYRLTVGRDLEALLRAIG